MTQTADEYVEWLRVKRQAPTTTTTNYLRLTRLWEAFVPTALADRTSEDVEAFTARPRRGGVVAKAATVAHEVAVVGSFHRWGMARYGWPNNPATLAAKPKVHNRQPRPVEDDAWLTLWTSDLDGPARVALGLGYFAGLRRHEIMALRGTNVWAGSLVNFARKCGGEDRMDLGDLMDHWVAFVPHLVVDRNLFEVPLRSLAQAQAANRLMPWNSTAPKALNKRLNVWLANVGLSSSDVTPHRLRHSFATNLMATGVPLDVACDLCNHSSPNITMRYVRTSGGRLAALRTSPLHASDSGH